MKYVDGRPKVGDIRSAMKKKLKGLKAVENREEPLSQEIKMYYTKTEDSRNCYNNGKNLPKFKGYKRSHSNPGFWHSASNNMWVCSKSSFRCGDTKSGSRSDTK